MGFGSHADQTPDPWMVDDVIIDDSSDAHRDRGAGGRRSPA
jgi:hypothetical protein